MKDFNFLEFEQPAGIFYLSVIPAHFLKQIYRVETRSDGEGIQREESAARISEITKYCDDPDAVFPTPIILAINSEDAVIEGNFLRISEEPGIASVIDGQHRIKGISQSSNIDKFTLPVVIVIDATEEEKAYIFSIINSKQTKVSASLIYDLFNVSQSRSPQKTCHEIARALNAETGSPFQNRLKMLGKGGGEFASLSQGAFVKRLLPLISKRPDEYLRRIKNSVPLVEEEVPFNKYFREEKDEIILKIVRNLFDGVRENFGNEWENPDKYILSKAIGYGAILKAFPKINQLGIENDTLTRNFFVEVFRCFRQELTENKVELTSQFFSSNEQDINRLSTILVASLKRFDIKNVQ